MRWSRDEFARSLTAVRAATVEAYRPRPRARSSRGPERRVPTARGRRSPARCAATSPTSPPAATPSARSPARRRRCGATSAGCAARAHRATTRPRALSAPEGRRPPAPRAPRRRARRAARRAAHPVERLTSRARAPARRRRARGALRQRAAGRRALRPRRRRRRPRRGRRRRSGARAPSCAGSPLGEPAVDAVDGWLATGRPIWSPREPPGRRRVPQPPGPAPHAPRRPADPRPPARRRRPTRTPCATPTLRTCSKAEPTCGRCRSCSATPTWRPPRSTLTSPATGCGPSTTRPTLVPRSSWTTTPAPTSTELWTDYKADGEREMPRAADPPLLAAGEVRRRSGRRGLPQNIEQSDLVSYGIFGLIDAIDKFDPGRGFKFETYAISRIKGAIIDELRSIDWVPRSVRAKARSIERAYSKLENELQRSPERRRGRGRARHDRDRARSRRCRRSRSSASSRSTSCSSAGRPRRRHHASATPSPTRATTRSRRSRSSEMKHLLADAINRMPDRERLVLTLYYYEGLTLAEIGRCSASPRAASARSTRRRSCSSAAGSPPPSGRTRLIVALPPSPGLCCLRGSRHAPCHRLRRPCCGRRPGSVLATAAAADAVLQPPVPGPIVEPFQAPLSVVRPRPPRCRVSTAVRHRSTGVGGGNRAVRRTGRPGVVGHRRPSRLVAHQLRTAVVGHCGARRRGGRPASRSARAPTVSISESAATTSTSTPRRSSVRRSTPDWSPRARKPGSPDAIAACSTGPSGCGTPRSTSSPTAEGECTKSDAPLPPPPADHIVILVAGTAPTAARRQVSRASTSWARASIHRRFCASRMRAAEYPTRPTPPSSPR